MDKSAQLLAAFSRTSAIGFVALDNKLRFRVVNKAVGEMHGIPAEAHIGMSLRDIIGDETPHAEALLRPVLVTGQTHWLEVGRMLPGRTELGYWIANYLPIQSRAGRVEQVGTLCVEVTEQRELEERFRKLGNELLWKKEEYRRLSRELHEAINGYHASLGMS